MGRPTKEGVSRFDGGMVPDIRTKTDRGFHISVHFDGFTNPKRLTPYRSSEANEDKTFNIVKFLAAFDGSLTQIFGLGVVSGTSRAKIFQKAGGTLAARITGAWTGSTSGEQTGGTARNEKIFFTYKSYLYGWRDGTTIWRWGDFTASPTFTDSYQSITYTDVAQPVHHPADDVAYFFSDNKVHSLNNITWSSNVLTLPDNLIITDGEPVGNLLAISCKPKAAGGKSVVFLWDRDSSLATISGKIDWGEGDLIYIGNLDGLLVGVTDYHLSVASLSLERGKLIIKIANGEKAKNIKEIQETDSDERKIAPTAFNKTVKDNKMYFTAAMNDENNTWRGVAVVDSEGRVTFDYVEEDASGSVESAYLVGNNWFIAHSADGSVQRTDDSANYTYTSIYQSQKFFGRTPAVTKKLLAVTVTTPPLPTAGQIVLKYRKDAETVWTTIFTLTTDNSIRKSATAKADGTNLPQYKEIQFRIESTGNAEVTGLDLMSEEIPDDIHDYG